MDDKNKPLAKLTANILFAGIGCQDYGFKKKGVIKLDVVNTSEIDKDATLTYAAIHHDMSMDMVRDYDAYPSVQEMVDELTAKNIGYNPEKNKPYNWNKHIKNGQEIIKKYWLASHLNKNLGDISRIEALQYADLWTVSFPCQSISCAGKMKGFKPDSGTRSSLLWENIRLLKRAIDDGIPPKFLMFENVKNLVSEKFMPDFQNLLDILSDLGYNTYWDIINGKFCGIPQNRERVFAVSVRKDVDEKRFHPFEFPKPFMCETKLSDLLDKDVPDKYILKSERSEKLVKKCICDKFPGKYSIKDGIVTLIEEEDGSGDNLEDG